MYTEWRQLVQQSCLSSSLLFPPSFGLQNNLRLILSNRLWQILTTATVLTWHESFIFAFFSPIFFSFSTLLSCAVKCPWPWASMTCSKSQSCIKQRCMWAEKNKASGSGLWKVSLRMWGFHWRVMQHYASDMFCVSAQNFQQAAPWRCHEFLWVMIFRSGY